MADLNFDGIINDEGELCGIPLLEAFDQIKAFCAEVEAALAAGNPDGALLANGTVTATGCLSYAELLQCGGDSNIPSLGMVKNLFDCGKVEGTTSTVNPGKVLIPGNGTLAGAWLDEASAGQVVKIRDNTCVIVCDGTGTPVPPLSEICVHYLRIDK